MKCPYSEFFYSKYFPAFALNRQRYSASLYIQSECGKIRTRKTPITDTIHAVAEDISTRSLQQKHSNKNLVYLMFSFCTACRNLEVFLCFQGA